MVLVLYSFLFGCPFLLSLVIQGLEDDGGVPLDPEVEGDHRIATRLVAVVPPALFDSCWFPLVFLFLENSSTLLAWCHKSSKAKHPAVF